LSGILHGYVHDFSGFWSAGEVPGVMQHQIPYRFLYLDKDFVHLVMAW
jgi:hypothetical protein